MATRNADVQLVIRAKNEADRALQSVTDALNRLLGTQEKVAQSASNTSGEISDFAKTFASLDKAFAAISGNADKAATAFQRQQSALAANKTELAAIKAQADAAAASIARLNSGDAIVSAGRDQSARLALLKQVQAEQSNLVASAERLTRSIAQQEAGLTSSRSSLLQLGVAENAVAEARSRATAQIDAQTAAIARQTDASQRAARAGQVQSRVDALSGINRTPATANGATFSALEAQAAADSAAAARLRAALDPVATIQRRYNNELQETIRLRKADAITAAELTTRTQQLAAAEKAEIEALQRGRANAPKVSLFGLAPYETQNLLFQVNDVVTQLGSGTSLSQTLAQQGGQIFQLFQNRIGPSIAAAFSNPAFLGAAAVLGLVVAAAARLQDRLEGIRQLSGVISFRADGASFDAAGLEKAAESLKKFGISTAEAREAFKQFINDGARPDQLTRLTIAAQQTADALGIKLTDAIKQVSDAFTGSVNSVLQLDDKLQFLTATQRAEIVELDRQGKAREAVARALDIYSAKAADAAAQSRGPWAQAMRDLSTAWSGFLDTIANSKAIQFAVEGLERIARGASRAINALNGLLGGEKPGLAVQIAQLQFDIATAQKIYEKDKNPARLVGIQDLQKRLEVLQQQYNATPRKTDPRFDTSGAADATSERDLKITQQLTEEEKRLQVEQLKRKRQEDQFVSLKEKQLRLEIARIDAAKKLEAFGAGGDPAVRARLIQESVDAEAAAIAKENASVSDRLATPRAQAKLLLKQAEGFRSSAYYDVNAYRVGYGSDTTTGPDGSVRRVTRDTTVTAEGANRDLERRIGDVFKTLERQIGSERLNSFTAPQQGALASIAYNYGSLPDRILNAVRGGTNAEIAAAVRGLGGDNKGVNRSRRDREAAILGQDTPSVEASNAQLVEQAALRQNKLNTSVAEENAARARTTAELEKQAKLRDTALVNEKIQAAGDRAVAELEKRVAEQNAGLKPYEKRIELTRQQIDETRRLAEEQQRAQSIQEATSARLSEVQRPVNDLTGQRDALRGRLDYLRTNGGSDSEIKSTAAALDEVNAKLRESIDLLIQYYQNLDPATDPLHRTKEQIDAAILGLRTAKNESREWGTILGISTKTIAQNISSGLAGAFDQFAQSVAEGKNVFASLKDAFLSFASSFLRQIAQMIIQATIFRLVSGLLGGLGGGGGGGATGGSFSIGGGGISSSFFHGGGIAGNAAARSASAPAAWFAGARRYHSGGIAGLRADEVPTILQRGEEVLTTGDPRHRFNGGGAGGGAGAAPNIKIVNAFDGSEALTQALNTKAGEKALLNYVKNNPGAFRAALSG